MFCTGLLLRACKLYIIKTISLTSTRKDVIDNHPGEVEFPLHAIASFFIGGEGEEGTLAAEM